MKKYTYFLIILLGLIATVGFTNSHVKKLCRVQTGMFVDLKQHPIETGKIQGQGVYQPLTTDSLYTDIRVANFQLAPGSYFDWQSLPGGRMIIVTEGEGYYQSKGKEAIVIRKGERIETIPGLYHWIGAAPDSKLEFISVTSQKSDELVHWHEPVAATEYQQVSTENK